VIVELKSDDMGLAYHRNGLYLTFQGGNQNLNVFWDRRQDRLGMPFKKGHGVGKILKERVLTAVTSQMTFNESQATAGIRTHLQSKHMGEKLVTQAKSQVSFVCLKYFSDSCLFRPEERVFLFLVHVWATSENYQAIVWL
jgi:hypothetical protein